MIVSGKGNKKGHLKRRIFTIKLSNEMIEFIKLGEEGLDKANDLIEKPENELSINQIKLLAPISKPSKILAVGLNYKEHQDEVAQTAAKTIGKAQEKYPNIIKQIRGKGFLIGIQLHKDQTDFIKKLMDNQLLTIRAAENVVRILPPLNVKKNEIDIAIKIIEKVCSQIK